MKSHSGRTGAALVWVLASGCTSIETARLSSNEVVANGTAIAVVQSSALGMTAFWNSVDVVQADLDTTVNRLLVSEAKAMGAMRVDLKSATTTPRNGVWALWGFPLPPLNLVAFPTAQATGIAVK